MRAMLATACFLLLCGPALADQPQPAAEHAAFVPLFNGKTFTGWEGDQKIFRIEDGAIVGGSLKHPVARNEFLATTKEYGDFELRLKFKLLGREANGGVQIRSQRVPHQPRDDRLPGGHGPALLGHPLRRIPPPPNAWPGQRRPSRRSSSTTRTGTTTASSARDGGSNSGSTARRRWTTPSPTHPSPSVASSACKSTAAARPRHGTRTL